MDRDILEDQMATNPFSSAAAHLPLSEDENAKAANRLSLNGKAMLALVDADGLFIDHRKTLPFPLPAPTTLPLMDASEVLQL